MEYMLTILVDKKAYMLSDTIGVKKVDLKKNAGWIILVTSKFFVRKKFQDFVGKKWGIRVF